MHKGHSWMAEFGNPDKPEDWEFMRFWSPYQMITEQERKKNLPRGGLDAVELDILSGKEDASKFVKLLRENSLLSEQAYEKLQLLSKKNPRVLTWKNPFLRNLYEQQLTKIEKLTKIEDKSKDEDEECLFSGSFVY